MRVILYNFSFFLVLLVNFWFMSELPVVF